MRRTLWLVAMVAGSAWAAPGRAQNPSNGDPFFLYYGWFLPQQAALAAQPRVQDTIQQNVAENQAYARTNRTGLYDPNGGYGRFNPYAESDPFGAGGRPSQGGFGSARVRSTVPTSNANGRGPSLYFNRSAQYYPSMATRSGQGPNKNVFVPGRGVRRGGMGMGMGMMGMPSMPGPR